MAGRKPPPEETRFKKGESGNPGGMPKGCFSPVKALKRLLVMSPEQIAAHDELAGAELVALSWYERALSGDGKSGAAAAILAQIANRTDGKVPDKIIGADGEEAGINVIFEVAERKPKRKAAKRTRKKADGEG